MASKRGGKDEEEREITPVDLSDHVVSFRPTVVILNGLNDYAGFLERTELRKISRGEAARRLVAYALRRVGPPDWDTRG